MIKGATHFVQACPVCGRPLRVCNDDMGCLVVCQHCRGQFIASYPDRSDRGGAEQGSSLMAHANGILERYARRLGVNRCWSLVRPHENVEHRICSVCMAETRDSSDIDVTEESSFLCEDAEVRGMPTALLMEHRDDVFSMLSASFVARGIRHIRVTSAFQAIRQYVRRPTDVLIVNGDQPNENAWLLAAKLHLTHPKARIWVYKRRLSACDVATANFLKINELIAYEGSFGRLAAEFLEHLVKLPVDGRKWSDKGPGTDQAVA